MRAKISCTKPSDSNEIIPTLSLHCDTEEEYVSATLFLKAYSSGIPVITEVFGPPNENDKIKNRSEE